MGNLIITVSRQFGSGGRIIGEKLAAQLGIPFFDKSIIQMASKESGLSPEFIEHSEERASSSFLYNLATSIYSNTSMYAMQYDTPVNDKAFYAQASVIHDLAEKGPCVIVGRCADYILREEDRLVRLFIRGELPDKIKRIKTKYELNLSESEVQDKIKKVDKSRANYYKYYTGEVWGNISNYDLVINSSFTGVDCAVALIRTMLKEKGYTV